MSISIQQLVAECGALLQPAMFDDYCPNGLQVQGAENVSRIVSGVTASQALIEAAIDTDADVLLVHHGYFWRGEDPRVLGVKQRRLKLLLEHNINLLAYHLPLDAHPTLGNNAQLAARLGISIDGGLGGEAPLVVGNIGRLANSPSAGEFAAHVAEVLGRQPLLEQVGDRPIQRIAWCTGAAQSYIEKAAAAGVDAFLSGEVSEQTILLARELGIHYIAAGHHATERYGVQALGAHLAGRFAVDHCFIDIDNPA